MNMIATGSALAERAPLPDPLIAAGIRYLVSRTDRQLALADPASERAFAESMRTRPIAEFTDDANAQHYELPPSFFELILGPRRKYSSCLYPTGNETLAEAEECALGETAMRAELADGQNILELGCGWGSLTLWMAEHYPRSRITAVSNSASQRNHIRRAAAERGLSNVEVITADMNDFTTDDAFDRVVSVEMFEHMANWRALLTRIRGWLKPDGKLFLHVFTHRCASYRFEVDDSADWIAKYFFTGGLMPSQSLIRQFDDIFTLDYEWRWSGDHYRRTALHWLANYDRNATAIMAILRDVYGEDAPLWRRRWRIFFLATAGLFGHAKGAEWGVGHFLLKPA
ncbi:MAG: cyclopropane-fatty-acyl-phospholipid synthase [Parvibaculum sp.]|uniref:SAM-dependent methyltransferase n=1 Tax=Parvibaculum sp. TaxID=2024848 RepID=UPI00283CE6F4|nr:cyclopropane-fatty-acyl-phospholipid synthase family protein [Parvibaculum sp.]MDR3499942.1 cyclopropane-fatty-acyl-phospholipid synthase [Parvibaculum sp.]